MCGRYIPNTEKEIAEIREILRRISIRISLEDLNVLENKDVCPTDTAPVICMNSGVTVAERARWGFNKWDGKGVIINARSETADLSKLFSPYVRSRRCVVPAHGYYEWMNIGARQKEKYVFTGCRPLFMAGLYRVSGERKEFVILTKTADDNIKFVHSRMPVILPENSLKDWLCPDIAYGSFKFGPADLSADVSAG